MIVRKAQVSFAVLAFPHERVLRGILSVHGSPPHRFIAAALGLSYS